MIIVYPLIARDIPNKPIIKSDIKNPVTELFINANITRSIYKIKNYTEAHIILFFFEYFFAKKGMKKI